MASVFPSIVTLVLGLVLACVVIPSWLSPPTSLISDQSTRDLFRFSAAGALVGVDPVGGVEAEEFELMLAVAKVGKGETLMDGCRRAQ